jgi:hypothetical protein
MIVRRSKSLDLRWLLRSSSTRPSNLNAAAVPRPIPKAPRIEACANRMSAIVFGGAAHRHLTTVGQLIDLSSKNNRHQPPIGV